MHNWRFYKMIFNNQLTRISLSVVLILLFSTSILFCQETEAIQQYQYAKKLAEDGLYDLAVTQFEEYLKLYPDSPNAAEAQFELAVLFGIMEQFEKSISALNLLMIKYPNYPRCDEARYLIAHNHIKNNEIIKGVKILEQISMFYPKSLLAPKAYYEAGNYWQQLNDPIRAEEIWLRVIEEYPQSTFLQNTRLQLARLYFQKKDYTTAQAQIDKILDYSPTGDFLANVSVLKAKIFTEQYKLEEAEQLFRQALKSKLSSNGQVRVKLAFADFLNKTDRTDLAKDELAPHISGQHQSSLQDSVILVWLHTLYKLADDQNLLNALDSHQHSFQDSSALTSAVELGIKSAIRVENHSTAIQYLKKRLSFEKLDRSDKPLIKQFHLQLIKQYRKKNLFADALQHGQMVLNWDWNDLNFTDQIRFNLAQIYQFELLQPRQALFYYEQILAPTHKSNLADETAFYMTSCYESLNDDSQTLQIYRNFSHTFPGSPLLDDVYKKLEWYQLYKPENSSAELNRLTIQLSSILLEENREKAILSLLDKTFNQFKDYEGAIQLVQIVENKDVMQNQKDKLNQISGESYYRLANVDEDSISRFDKLENARTSLLQYLTAASENSEKIRIAMIIHDIDRQKKRLSTLDFLEEYDFLNQLVQRFPDLNETNSLRFKLARLLHNYGIRVTQDSIQSAIKYYNELVDTPINNEISSLDNSIPTLFSISENLNEYALFYRGNAYLSISDTIKAITDFQKYRENFSKGKYIVPILKKLGEISTQNKVWENAEQFYSDLSERFYYSPVVDSVKIELAKIKIELGKFEDAINLLKSLQDYEPALYHLAKAFQKSGKNLEARRKYNEYLNRYPNGQFVVDCYYKLYEMAQENRQKEEVNHYSRMFLRRFPEDSRRLNVLTQLANQQFENENYKEAINQYNDLISTYPNDLNLKKKRLICMIKLGNVSAAKAAVETINKQFDNPKEELAEIEYEIGDYYLKEKYFETAEKQFDHVKSKYKRTKYAVFAEYGLGKLKLVTNKTEDGLDIITKIPEKYPEHAVLSELYLTLGDFYYKEKQFPNAAAAFNRVLESNPKGKTEIVTRKYLIKVYSDVGQYEASLISLQRFLSRFPDDEDAFTYKINLGVTLRNVKEYDRAVEHLKSLIPFADNAQEAEIRYLIGDCYFNWGQFSRAVLEYLKVIYLTQPTQLPWHVTAEYRSGEAYMKLREWEKAKQLFDKIVKKEGAGSDFGRAALAKLQELEQLQQN